jgi:hypothetical protein
MRQSAVAIVAIATRQCKQFFAIFRFMVASARLAQGWLDDT